MKMNATIVAKKVTVIHRNGLRSEYTHVTEVCVNNIPAKLNMKEPYLIIKGETDSVVGNRCNVLDKLPIEDLMMTIIDWYTPK